MVNEVELFTGEVLKLNSNGIWEIYENEESTIGYPVDLLEIIVNVNKFIIDKYHNEK